MEKRFFLQASGNELQESEWVVSVEFTKNQWKRITADQ